jgi:spermidine synthase
MHRVPTIWKANTIVFISSFCVMVIELVAARILAPQIGISLYTWTSIIGVILAGIALGNYIGGKIADRYVSPALLVTILLAGALLTMALLPLSKSITNIFWFNSLHLMLNSTMRVLCLFFLPATILSMVSPMVIKLTLADLGKTGGVVGTIYACSTAGAILGTFMTGFYFILWFGTRITVWLVIAVLFLIALIAWFSWKMSDRWKVSAQNIAMWIMVLLVILGTTLLFTFRDSWQQNYLKESNYFSIRIITGGYYDASTETTRVSKALALDHLIHSFTILDDPTIIGYNYLRIFAKIIEFHAGENPSPAILYLGGGGYSLPRYMDAMYPNSINDVVEIDPVVTEAVHEELGLPRNTRISTYNEDARIFFIKQSVRGKYDYVIGDAFNDISVPYHLTTLEFNRLVKDSMKEGGIYLVNIIDTYYRGKFLPAYIHTLQQTFKYVYMLSSRHVYLTDDYDTFILVATDEPIELEKLYPFAIKSEKNNAKFYIVEAEQQAAYLAERKPPLLTDDYAPTDALLAPAFRQRQEVKKIWISP